MLLVLKMERGHEPKNTALEAGENKEANSPLELSGETQACWYFDFSPEKLSLDFDFKNYKIINVLF